MRLITHPFLHTNNTFSTGFRIIVFFSLPIFLFFSKFSSFLRFVYVPYCLSLCVSFSWLNHQFRADIFQLNFCSFKKSNRKINIIPNISSSVHKNKAKTLANVNKTSPPFFSPLLCCSANAHNLAIPMCGAVRAHGFHFTGLGSTPN